MDLFGVIPCVHMSTSEPCHAPSTEKILSTKRKNVPGEGLSLVWLFVLPHPEKRRSGYVQIGGAH
jgi:hypothetical protein